MHHVLFVDRMAAADADRVAEVWAAHDATGLPGEIGLTQRVLFRFHGLYFHLVQADGALRGNLYDRIAAQRTNPLYREVRDGLSPFLTPFSPNFTTLGDTKAEEFYRWQA